MATLIDMRLYAADGSLVFPPYESDDPERVPCVTNGRWKLARIPYIWAEGGDEWVCGYGRTTCSRDETFVEFVVYQDGVWDTYDVDAFIIEESLGEPVGGTEG